MRRVRQRPGFPVPPDLAGAAPVDALPGNTLADEQLYTHLILSRPDFADQSASDLGWEHVHLKHGRLGGTRWQRPQLLDVRADVCDLAAAEWHKARLNRVALQGCRLLGWKLAESTLDNVLFADCAADLAAFWSSRFRATRFERCVLTEASFEGAQLDGVIFRDCDLQRANFEGARLHGADFRGSNLAGMVVGINELQGAMIEPAQALHLASLLGLIVKPLDD